MHVAHGVVSLSRLRLEVAHYTRQGWAKCNKLEDVVLWQWPKVDLERAAFRKVITGDWVKFKNCGSLAGRGFPEKPPQLQRRSPRRD